MIRELVKEVLVKFVSLNIDGLKIDDKKSKYLKKIMLNDEVNRIGVSIQMDGNRENRNVKGKNLLKVSKKKRKKNKIKIDVDSVEIFDVKFENIFIIELNKNLNGKVKKLIFNLVILFKMLVLVLEFKIDSFIENKIEFRKKKKCKEMKKNEEGEKVRMKIKNYRDIEFENKVKVEEVRKEKKKRKEIKVDEEVDFEKVFLKFFFLKERLMEQLNFVRFRYINEQLYIQIGQEVQEMFEEDEEAFQVYY